MKTEKEKIKRILKNVDNPNTCECLYHEGWRAGKAEVIKQVMEIDIVNFIKEVEQELFANSPDDIHEKAFSLVDCRLFAHGVISKMKSRLGELAK